MNDHHTKTLDHYQGLVDQLAEEDAALAKLRTDFAEQLMQEYTEDNHNISWQVAEWIGDDSSHMEGFLFSAITDLDFNMGEVWRDWLTEKFEELSKGMSIKQINAYVQEYF